MMIETIQMWIWNIGGLLFTLLIVLATLTWIFSWTVNRLSGWHKKEFRENLLYWIKHKKEICKIIEDKKNKAKTNKVIKVKEYKKSWGIVTANLNCTHRRFPFEDGKVYCGLYPDYSKECDKSNCRIRIQTKNILQ